MPTDGASERRTAKPADRAPPINAPMPRPASDDEACRHDDQEGDRRPVAPQGGQGVERGAPLGHFRLALLLSVGTDEPQVQAQARGNRGRDQGNGEDQPRSGHLGQPTGDDRAREQRPAICDRGEGIAGDQVLGRSRQLRQRDEVDRPDHGDRDAQQGGDGDYDGERCLEDEGQRLDGRNRRDRAVAGDEGGAARHLLGDAGQQGSDERSRKDLENGDEAGQLGSAEGEGVQDHGEPGAEFDEAEEGVCQKHAAQSRTGAQSAQDGWQVHPNLPV
jgi:hypothetical protein